MADEAFSLKDAIALYSGKIDLSHKSRADSADSYVGAEAPTPCYHTG
jgi:hypothetical protein